MNAAVTVPTDLSIPLAQSITDRFVKVWVDVCDGLRAVERQKIILGEPSEKELADFRGALKAMLRLGRMLQAQVNDPDFTGSPKFVVEVGGRIIQLQYAWDALNNPMTAEEADALMANLFPDETRT